MTVITSSPLLSEAQERALGNVSALYQLPDMHDAAVSGVRLRFGLIADPQYADADVQKERHYRNSLNKLATAINELNDLKLDFVVTLGDLVDRDWSSYQAVLARYEALRHPHAVLIGNHDAQVISQHLAAQSPALGLPKSYYQFSLPGYRFLVIDGNDVSLYCNHANGEDRQLAEFMLDELTECQQSQAQPWNGAVGRKQLEWIEQNLKQARAQGETVLVFGHYPLTPVNTHNLWNCETLVELLCRYNVRAYFAGHDHRGGYDRVENTDFITLKGMVDGESSLPFSSVTLNGEVLTITGYGPEVSRVLSRQVESL
jgi:3',5'-cyclic AMP phosphodiesterase CpdA